MKILYGIQTTGNGHICRSREIVAALKRRGHEIQVILSGRASTMPKELQVFAPYTILRGLTFISEKGRLKPLKTAMGLNFAQLYRDIGSFDVTGVDLVITDFEPISARIARRHGIPSIGIAHQYAFSYDVPIARGYPLGLFILKNFAPADYLLGLHWHHFGQPVLPPIVPGYLKAGPQALADKIVVYLPFEDLGEIRRQLGNLAGHQFYIYHGSCGQKEDAGNLHFRPLSREGFLGDLRDCGGVICNAGFELTSEALHLGKRVLAKPLAGQIEQESNALAMSRLGLGTVFSKLNPDLIRTWLETAPVSSAEAAAYPNVTECIAEWVAGRRWNNIGDFARAVWDMKC